LGWGEERFFVISISYRQSSSEDNISKALIPSSIPSTEWGAIEVEEVTDELLEFCHPLMPLLDEW